MIADAINNPASDDPEQILRLWNAAQRLILAEEAGLTSLPELNGEQGQLCTEAPKLPVEDELQNRLAQLFLDSPASVDNPNIMLLVAHEGTDVAKKMIGRYLADGTQFDIVFYDYEFTAALIETAELSGLKKAGEYLTNLFADDRIQKVNVVGAQQDPKTAAREPREKAEALKAWIPNGFRSRASSIDKYYTLTRIPTLADAERDGIDYAEYVRLFFEMCDQPWDQIQAAQALLINDLNAASTIRITNEDGTDITFDISGQTFANSVIAKNIPGSEIFSSPLIAGTTGVIVAKGQFAYMDQGVQRYMQDLRLEFRHGELTSAIAEVGNDDLQAIVGKPGANRIGEVAFGTNPWFRTHVSNGLLVEKIGGSFHLALGAAYEYKTYLGNPVQLDNGNRSKVHWDITTMLHGKGGKVWLDGNLIQQDGLFTDPRFNVLNEGWRAVPEHARPAVWTKLLSERAARQQ